MPPSNTSSKQQPSKKLRAAQAAASSKGGIRNRATAAASVAQPELAPFLQGANAVHEKVFGGKGRLTSSNKSRLLLVEFLVCMVILGAGTILSPQGSKDGVPRLMTRGSGLSLLFFVLALASGGGARSKRAAEALGGLVTVSYLVLSSDALNIFKWVTSFFGGSAAEAGQGVGDVGAAAASATEAGQGVADLGSAAAQSGSS